MTYDADNELTSVTYSGGTTPDVTNISYDSDGQRTSMTDGTGTSTLDLEQPPRPDQLHRWGGGRGPVPGQPRRSGDPDHLPGQPHRDRGLQHGGPMDVDRGLAGQHLHLRVRRGWEPDQQDAAGGDLGGGHAAFNAADQLTSITDTKGSSTLFSATYGRNGDGGLTSDSSVPSSGGVVPVHGRQPALLRGLEQQLRLLLASLGEPGIQLRRRRQPDRRQRDDPELQRRRSALLDGEREQCAMRCSTAPTGATSYAYNAEGDLTTMTPASGSATNLGYNQANQLTSYGPGVDDHGHLHLQRERPADEPDGRRGDHPLHLGRERLGAAADQRRHLRLRVRPRGRSPGAGDPAAGDHPRGDGERQRQGDQPHADPPDGDRGGGAGGGGQHPAVDDDGGCALRATRRWPRSPPPARAPWPRRRCSVRRW